MLAATAAASAVCCMFMAAVTFGALRDPQTAAALAGYFLLVS